MRFDDGFVEQVRSSVNIVDLVSNYVSLKKSGQNHSGLCPFHDEKTPSFLVSDSKQIFKCFGCGVGGDAFKFLSLIENLTFPEAVQQLAQRFGIPLPKSMGREEGSESERPLLLGLMRNAERLFREELRSNEGKMARRYLEDREITEETIERFGIGFAPPGNQMLRYLRKEGYSEKLGLTCGLLKEGHSGSLYDAFRSRIIFPIRDLADNPIAFGGRILGDGVPKYLNSQDTPLYNKSRNLFALNLARSEIRQSGFVILVEGYFDCVVPYQFGFRNIVASLGTSLTPQQTRTLKRYARNVILNYDSDAAGLAASIRSIELLLSHGLRVNVLQLPLNVDPDTYLRENGPREYELRLKESINCIEFVLSRFLEEVRDPESPRGKQELVEKIIPFLKKMPDRIERSEYLSRVASRLKVEEDLVRVEMRRAVSGQERQSPLEPIRLLEKATWAEMTLLAGVLDPSWSDQVLSNVERELFCGLRTERIFDKVLEFGKLNPKINILYLRDSLDDEGELHFLDAVAIHAEEVHLTEETVLESIRALRRKQYELLSQKIQQEIASEEATDSKSSRIDELLLKKEEIRRKIESDLM